VPSMSTRTVVYKGLLLANQVGRYYRDLQDPRTVSALALVHQQDPALEVDGEMRAECALDSALRRSILPNSTLRGRCIS